MGDSSIYKNDFYIISEDFRLLDFNQNVKDRYDGIQIGDLCYKATMKRDTPCQHCPIAGNTRQDCPIYFDPFYGTWVEALFSELGDGRYAVICRTVQENEQSIFEQLQKEDYHIANNLLEGSDSENIGMIGGYCEDGFPLYYVNHRMIKMLGYDSREEFEEGIKGMVVNTIHPDDLPQVSADLGDHYYVGMKYETSYRMPRKDGSWFWTIDRGEVIEAADGRLAIISVCLDITASVATLENARIAADSANKAKSAFLFNMSHDIRTPMNAIFGYTDLLEKNLDDPVKSKGYLFNMRKAEEILLALINNVLEMSKIESGKAVLNEEVQNINFLNDNFRSIFKEKMIEKNIEFTRETHVEHNLLYVDQTKMRQIFINILSNAFKYTPAGGKISVCIRELPSDREGTVLIESTIKDTGIGMSKEFLPHIFEEFSREHTTTESKVEGTGLGLPIVKKLVDLLGGTIEVHSESGKGSTFIVTTPHRIAQEKETLEQDTDVVDTSRFTGKRILLAEDNDLNAEIAMEILKEAGLVVSRARDGIECLDMIEHSEAGYYDLILMDIQMPNMDGYKATQSIRALDDVGKAAIPIVAMTANAFKEDRDKAIASGMNGHVAKPIDIAELFHVLDGALK